MAMAKFEQINEQEGYFFILSQGEEKKILARKSIGGLWFNYQSITDINSKLVTDKNNGIKVSFRKSKGIKSYTAMTGGYSGNTRPVKNIEQIR